jgi:hypothetical protein
VTPVRVATAALAAALAGVGLWALVEAHSFFEVAAPYEPFNPHFIHDIGAFALGLAGCLAAALVVRDGLLAALLGASAFGVAHFAAHVRDHDLGGSASDPYTFGVVALVFAGLAFARWKGSGGDRLI